MPPGPRLRTVALHALAWAALAYLAGWLRFEHAVKPGDTLADPEDLEELLAWLLLIGFFYLHLLRIAPRLYFAGRRRAYAAAVVGGLALVLAVPYALTAVLAGTSEAPPRTESRGRGGGDPARSSPARLAREYSGFALLYGVAILGTLSTLSQRRLRQREAEARRGELAQLQAQVHPHFLFNTLNGLYGLAVEEDAHRSAEALLRVSDFLRYASEHAGAERVALALELAHLRDYLALQQLRLGDTVCVDFRCEGAPCGKTAPAEAMVAEVAIAAGSPIPLADDPRVADPSEGSPAELTIAPLLVLTLVENAFKHGVSPERDSWIDISVACRGPHFELRVVNSRVRDEAGRRAANGGGLGLANARRRLELDYPGRHRLTVDDAQPDRYVAELALELDAAETAVAT